ncbi:hypothetical protein [Methylobacterium sp. NEAU K]|uniref:hypothetical protein n=1 Tax=Methylobacterium sp. NEAU K TaxID=3064946 RepID=UPI002736C28C|nr:hypothetical protein [Methylobacterium sp. NEAU K]MDP4002161.1 hypothetical protein [Methylobacterium sp. NEAU K]
MTLTDFVIPTVAAAMFTFVSYGILRSEHRHSETIGEVLWVVFCMCATLSLIAMAGQMAEPVTSRGLRGVAQDYASDGPSRYRRAIARGSMD